MIDREKVIKGLEHCLEIEGDGSCVGCPYDDDCFSENVECSEPMMRDALALLKAQEPNEDWISRKRLRDEIQYYIDEAGWGDEVNKVLGWCLEFIDNQEAVKWE